MYLESRITFSLIIGAMLFARAETPKKENKRQNEGGREEVTIIFLVKKSSPRTRKNPRKGKQNDFVYDGAKSHKKQYSSRIISQMRKSRYFCVLFRRALQKKNKSSEYEIMEKEKKRHTKSYVRGNEMMMILRKGPQNTPEREESERERGREREKEKVLSHYYKSVFIFISPHQKYII
jgi:hypothetical protein